MKLPIPVFYHIPKNAGTYVSDWMLVCFRYYRRNYTDWLKRHIEERDSIKCLRIIKDGFIVAKVLIGDPYSFCEQNLKFTIKHSKTEWDIKIEDITASILTNLFVFGCVIEGRGFKINNRLLSIFEGYTLYQFLILRNCFSRAHSIYNYIKSERSSHELTHRRIKVNTFEEYILSEQLEDSWLIRNLLNIDNSVPLNEQHCNDAIDMLTSFNIYDIAETNYAIQKTFLECYNFDIQKIKLNSWDTLFKNEGLTNQLKIENLSKEIQDVFNNRTVWDNKIYNTFIK